MKQAALESFICEWKELENKQASLDALENFISDWKELKKTSTLKNFINEYSSISSEMLYAGNCVDLLGIDEIGRNEKPYSAYLAWILDAQADHGQGNIFFREFIKRVQPDFLEKISEIDTYSVKTENQVNKYIRFDITLEGEDFVIAIEVKVDSQENKRQLKKYMKYLDNLRDFKVNIMLIYLTKDGLEGSAKEAISVKWHTVADAIYHGLKQMGDKNSLAFQVISQFRDRIINL